MWISQNSYEQKNLQIDTNARIQKEYKGAEYIIFQYSICVYSSAVSLFPIVLLFLWFFLVKLDSLTSCY